jgi:signal transduction histidine kinase
VSASSSTPKRALARASGYSLLLLGASLGVVALTTSIAVVAAWKSRANTKQLLKDYAAFAAWSYSERLGNELGETSWFALNPIAHRQPHQSSMIPDADDLPSYLAMNLEQCRCNPPAKPSTYFRFRLGSDSVTTAGASLPASTEGMIAGFVGLAVRSDTEPGQMGMVPLPGAGQVVAYGIMPTAWGDTIVYGFTFDSLSLVTAFDSVLRGSPLLPATVTGGRANAELFALEIRDHAGSVLYRSRDWPASEREWPYIAEEPLPPNRGGFITRLTLIPGAAPALLAGGLPRTPLPLLLLVAVLGIGAAAVALAQMRREGALARLRSDFVAGVSHELRTPLAQIRLFLDTLRLKRYDTPAEQAWLLGHLSRETTRLEHLVENVLAVSRLDRGVPTSAPLEPLDLGREVAEAVTAFAPLAASRHVSFQSDLPTGVGVLADQATLRQLLLNLFDNAVKFGPPGQVVRVGVARVNGSARLSVTDQGPGVPEDERDRIWEPYYRGSSSAARAVGGSGIGLAIVRTAADRFGGEVSVTSAPQGGAEFTVVFPTLESGAGES